MAACEKVTDFQSYKFSSGHVCNFFYRKYGIYSVLIFLLENNFVIRRVQKVLVLEWYCIAYLRIRKVVYYLVITIGSHILLPTVIYSK